MSSFVHMHANVCRALNWPFHFDIHGFSPCLDCLPMLTNSAEPCEARSASWLGAVCDPLGTTMHKPVWPTSRIPWSQGVTVGEVYGIPLKWEKHTETMVWGEAGMQIQQDLDRVYLNCERIVTTLQVPEPAEPNEWAGWAHKDRVPKCKDGVAVTAPHPGREINLGLPFPL